jgi:GT2 family glycosyltransferase
LNSFVRRLASGFSRGRQATDVPTRSGTSIDPKKHYSELIDLNWMATQYKNRELDECELENLFRSGVDPNPYFDSDWYLWENKDLSDSDLDPLMHYVTFGENEGRKPNPLFDPVSYLEKYPELKDFPGTLLSHFIGLGMRQGKNSAVVDNSAEFESASKLALVNLEKYADLFVAQKVAVVIPVYNNWCYTERCIRAIQKTVDFPFVQIFIINDGSTDETLQELKRYPDVKVFNNPVNSGYLKACNFSFTQLSDYEYLFLLNNDTEPNSGFVANAMEVIQSNDDAAVVGSTLISSDGKLQAAGGMVGSDGTCLHWGDLDSKKSSKYRYTRKIDYVPFAAVLVRNSELKKIGGFDERFAPAYCEDVDFAFQIREIGGSVYVSSESTVFHFGSKSYGAGESDLGSRTNLINKKKFHEKWRVTLESSPYSQSRVPLQPAIQEFVRSIMWKDFDLASDMLREKALELMKHSMTQGYRVIFQTDKQGSANLHLAKFRNNGIQVTGLKSEKDVDDYLEQLPDYVWASESTKLVYEEVRNEIYFEAKNANLSARKIAVLAQWSESQKLAYSTERLIQELLNCEFEIVLVSACESSEHLNVSQNLLDRITVVRKPNFGYDFGSWSVALQALPEIELADEVLLLNDSLIGPFGKLDEILNRMNDSPYSVTGLTDSIEIDYHIQSYMVHFKDGSLRNEVFQNFWRNVKHEASKNEIIRNYEIGMSRLALENRIYMGAVFPFNLTPNRWGASSKSNLISLINNGFPFVKAGQLRELEPNQILELKELLIQKFQLSSSELEAFFA